MIGKQGGENKKYPTLIETWKFGDEIPEWLSNEARWMRGENGTLTLDIRELNTGGYEIIKASGVGTLCTAKSKDSYICFGDGKIFSLTPEQYELLYE